MTFTLVAPFQLQEEIKKSRFLVNAAPINSIEEVQHYLAIYSDATANHNCWAWKLAQQYRFNDDGEPSGTAGRPILSAIEGNNCDGVLVVVTRWFGGIKLGAGGLIRAYGGTAAHCLQQANLQEVIAREIYQIHCYYNEWPLLEVKLREFNIQLQQQQFDALGTLVTLSIPIVHIQVLQQWLGNLTKGREQAIKVA